MNAIRVHETGGPEVLRWETVPDPIAGTGEIVVRIEASGVNFIDIYQREGLYPVPLPFTPGQEAAGTVTTVGSGVTEARVGDRVAWAGLLGSYAEVAAVPAARTVLMPGGLDARLGAAAILQGMTAHYLATSTYPLKEGETCLIHAGAGGVGLLLTQIAKRRGARVITTVSTAEKAALSLEAGADHVIRYTEQDFAAESRRLTDGAGVQVVYDSVGKTTFAHSLDALAHRGILVLFGQSSGPVDPIYPQVLNRKGSLYLTRPTLMHYAASRSELLQRAGEILEWIQAGTLSLRIGLELPLKDAAEAHRQLEGRCTTGKVLLIP